MAKHANPDHPIHELIGARWSPYGFSPRPVATEDLQALFEAARWAPSSYNEQPWRYIVATREQGELFGKVLACLWEPNQVWARHAPVLALALTAKTFARNGKENPAAEHDLGLAAAHLSLEATARGLAVHQMIGIHPDKVYAAFAVPQDTRPLTALAIGYRGRPEGVDHEIIARDRQPRQRRPLSEFVFGAGWEVPAEIAG